MAIEGRMFDVIIDNSFYAPRWLLLHVRRQGRHQSSGQDEQ
ncbi:hypothetical protein LINPERHAP2_LOCUS32985 [Linum perenne]